MKKLINRWYPESTKIHKISVDKTTNKVVVTFRNLSKYAYHNVPEQKWKQILNSAYIEKNYSGSIGRAFNAVIIADSKGILVERL